MQLPIYRSCICISAACRFTHPVFLKPERLTPKRLRNWLLKCEMLSNPQLSAIYNMVSEVDRRRAVARSRRSAIKKAENPPGRYRLQKRLSPLPVIPISAHRASLVCGYASSALSGGCWSNGHRAKPSCRLEYT